VVRVKVLGVDAARKRISLTLRLDDEPGGPAGQARAPRPAPGRQTPARQRLKRDETPAGGGGAMADALRRAGLAGDRRSQS
jgi:protein Tex